MIVIGQEDKLGALISNAEELVRGGYYRSSGKCSSGPSLAHAILEADDFPIIAEVKLASPTTGRMGVHMAENLIDDYLEGGACAISVLTEPRFFKGSLRYLELASRSGLPTLMKDFIIDAEQLGAASERGASAVLLIERVFSRLGTEGLRDDLIIKAHDLGLEVVLEAGNLDECERIKESGADIIAYNRRDLDSFKVNDRDYSVCLKELRDDDRPMIMMSGIGGPRDMALARMYGADGVLIGTALSSSPSPKDMLRRMRIS